MSNGDDEVVVAELKAEALPAGMNPAEIHS